MADAQTTQADAFERKLAGWVRTAVPVATLASALVLVVMVGPGPAILVLAAGVLLGAVMALWTSLRSLTGDAPLAEGFDDGGIKARASEAESSKRAALRALKDLEHERAIGKIDEADYAALSGQLRDRAKTLLRELDDEIAPMRARAEQIALAHLKKKGLLPAGPDEATAPAAAESSEAAPEAAPAAAPEGRPVCAKCGTSNDHDAAFCKKCGAPMGDAPGEEA